MTPMNDRIPWFLTSVLLLLPADFFAAPASASSGIPVAALADGTHEYADEGLRFADYSHTLHAVFAAGGLSRSSEMGHENYRPELGGDIMRERGERWLRLLRKIDRKFHEQGRLYPFATTDGHSDDKTPPRLSDYPHGVYAYHMHHRAGRWEAHGLETAITYAGLPYLVEPGIRLLEEHFADGRFYADKTQTRFDNGSMAHGLAGLAGHAYAWARWKKPEGAEDMGAVPLPRLKAWLRYGPDELAALLRESASVLGNAWDSRRKAYVFGDDPVWSLEEIGSLLRGAKVIYETLYIFGDDEARTAGETVFNQTAAMLREVLKLSRDWGLPERVAFTENGAEAASDRVDTAALWNLVNHAGSGFALFSEGDGMSPWFSASGLGTEVAAAIDRWLLGAPEHHLKDGWIVAAVSYGSGEVIDDRFATVTAGQFTVAAANNYGRGESFVRAADWDAAGADLVERTRDLYDTILRHAERLESRISD